MPYFLLCQLILFPMATFRRHISNRFPAHSITFRQMGRDSLFLMPARCEYTALILRKQIVPNPVYDEEKSAPSLHRSQTAHYMYSLPYYLLFLHTGLEETGLLSAGSQDSLLPPSSLHPVNIPVPTKRRTRPHRVPFSPFLPFPHQERQYGKAARRK